MSCQIYRSSVSLTPTPDPCPLLRRPSDARCTRSTTLMGSRACGSPKSTRRPDRHELHEWIVDVRLGGDFAAAYTAGDNRQVIATDTMKNLVYVLAADARVRGARSDSRYVHERISRDYPQVESATVTVEERVLDAHRCRGQGRMRGVCLRRRRIANLHVSANSHVQTLRAPVSATCRFSRHRTQPSAIFTATSSRHCPTRMTAFRHEL